MNELAYSTASNDQSRGWEAFDRLILWALSQRPGQSIDDIAEKLPAGISYRLIRKALDAAVSGGIAVRVLADEARYQIAPETRSRTSIHTRPGHKAAA